MELLSEEHKAYWLEFWKIPPEKADEEWSKKIDLHTRRGDLHQVIPDTPGYYSPVTGKWIEGKKARRDDLARTGSRPWEGMEQEQKEAARRKAYEDQKADKMLDKSVRQAWYQLDPRKREKLLKSM